MWYRNAKTADKLKAKLAEDDPVEYSDAEEQYSEIVAGIKQVYENSPATTSRTYITSTTGCRITPA